jgi:hypothetical protein
VADAPQGAACHAVRETMTMAKKSMPATTKFAMGKADPHAAEMARRKANQVKSADAAAVSKKADDAEKARRALNRKKSGGY